MNGPTIIKNLRLKLQAASDPSVAASSKHFFKEEVKVYGLKSPSVTKISKDYFKEIKNYPKKEIFGLCETLWESGYMEECMIACQWSYNLHAQYTEDDISVFERWLELYVTNWATCDTLCNHTVGTLVEMYPGLISYMKKWAVSPNRWIRRAAAVTLIIPARKGLFHNNIFEIADILLTDGDDLVQKGYGWMLKAAADHDARPVFDYVMSKRSVMPRTALKYAIEKMPPELKKEAMKKP